MSNLIQHQNLKETQHRFFNDESNSEEIIDVDFSTVQAFSPGYIYLYYFSLHYALHQFSNKTKENQNRWPCCLGVSSHGDFQKAKKDLGIEEHENPIVAAVFPLDHARKWFSTLKGALHLLERNMMELPHRIFYSTNPEEIQYLLKIIQAKR